MFAALSLLAKLAVATAITGAVWTTVAGFSQIVTASIVTASGAVIAACVSTVNTVLLTRLQEGQRNAVMEVRQVKQAIGADKRARDTAPPHVPPRSDRGEGFAGPDSPGHQDGGGQR